MTFKVTQGHRNFPLFDIWLPISDF